ncbi:unnamed protein product [Nyctereutes procyonoides]|uniref:(raccoon dog) hypothetical protein n=1 Tax=Nyctereutes procyonoides TaxID=34880 RepID=A0A811YTF3_NYCPR|nr:unnamed protein product [Nyctereutes procyonoides]
MHFIISDSFNLITQNNKQTKKFAAEVVEPLKVYVTLIERNREAKQSQIEIFDNFGKQKIKDIKIVFSECIITKMLFLGKALKVYTAAYQNIQKIDEEDLEVFQNSLYPPDHSSSLDFFFFSLNIEENKDLDITEEENQFSSINITFQFSS